MLLDERISASSIEERVAWNEERRRLGHRLVWQQADAAGATEPLDQAEFLLRRLYPEMPDDWFKVVLAKLSELHEAGRWNGFERAE
jgi:hypothetical protein